MLIYTTDKDTHTNQPLLKLLNIMELNYKNKQKNLYALNVLSAKSDLRTLAQMTKTILKLREKEQP
jgi:hypothetical protein